MDKVGYLADKRHREHGDLYYSNLNIRTTVDIIRAARDCRFFCLIKSHKHCSAWQRFQESDDQPEIKSPDIRTNTPSKPVQASLF